MAIAREYVMRYQFKPCRNLHLNFMWIFYICPVLPLDIGCVIVCLNRFEIEIFITCAILTSLPLLVFVMVRLFYPYRYIIDDQYISKYKGKKILFKIQIKDLKAIMVKKATLFDYFKFVASLISYNLTTSYVTTISFIFDKYDILNDFGSAEFKRESLNDGVYPNALEQIEIVTVGDAKKICKLLKR